MMYKFKNSSQPTGTGTVKNFWVYALVLFSAAIILIMVGQYYQSIEYKKLQLNLQTESQSGKEKASALQNVQDLNESLKKQISTLNEQLEEAKGSVTSAQYDIDTLTKDLSETMTICEAQTLYFSGKYSTGRKKLAELNYDTLSENVKALYDAAKKLIK